MDFFSFPLLCLEVTRIATYQMEVLQFASDAQCKNKRTLFWCIGWVEEVVHLLGNIFQLTVVLYC